MAEWSANSAYRTACWWNPTRVRVSYTVTTMMSAIQTNSTVTSGEFLKAQLRVLALQPLHHPANNLQCANMSEAEN